jgi:hypothetical protein
MRVAQAVYSEQVPGGEGGERERVAIGHDVRRAVAEMGKRRKEIAKRWLELQSETDEMAEQQKQMLVVCIELLPLLLSPIAQALAQ